MFGMGVGAGPGLYELVKKKFVPRMETSVPPEFARKPGTRPRVPVDVAPAGKEHLEMAVRDLHRKGGFPAALRLAGNGLRVLNGNSEKDKKAGHDRNRDDQRTALFLRRRSSSHVIG